MLIIDTVGQEQLEITEKVLVKNPDIYTFWNIRREVLIKFENESAAVCHIFEVTCAFNVLFYNLGRR